MVNEGNANCLGNSPEISFIKALNGKATRQLIQNFRRMIDFSVVQVFTETNILENCKSLLGCTQI